MTQEADEVFAGTVSRSSHAGCVAVVRQSPTLVLQMIDLHANGFPVALTDL